MSVLQAVEFARAGYRAAIIGEGASRSHLPEAEVHAGRDSTKVRRAIGNARIDFRSGGRRTFHRSPEDLRGHSLDVVYLTSPDLAAAPGAMSTIEPCFATSVLGFRVEVFA